MFEISAAFSPWSGLAGGALIGAAASVLMLTTGRIAGISGIFGAVVTAPRHMQRWQLAFIIGLLSAWPLYRLISATEPALEVSSNTLILIVAGLLVGIGTRMGSGCTSGHGVCGLARGSGRSLAATLTFMLSAVITIALVRWMTGGLL